METYKEIFSKVYLLLKKYYPTRQEQEYWDKLFDDVKAAYDGHPLTKALLTAMLEELQRVDANG